MTVDDSLEFTLTPQFNFTRMQLVIIRIQTRL